MTVVDDPLTGTRVRIPDRTFQTMTLADVTPALIQRATTGDRDALKHLVEALRPVIHRRVHRALARHRAQAQWSREDSVDLVQECFVLLLADGGQVLRQWDPARGASLANWVGIVVERRVRDILRRDGAKRDENVRDHAPPHGYESIEATAEVSLLFSKLRSSLSSRGAQLFERLWINDEDVTSVALALKMNEKAVYATRKRLQVAVLALLSPVCVALLLPLSHHGQRSVARGFALRVGGLLALGAADDEQLEEHGEHEQRE